MSRKYTKKSKYWDKFSSSSSQPIENVLRNQSQQDWEPMSMGDPFFEEKSEASYSRSRNSGQALGRRNSISSSPKTRPYANIYHGLSPFDYSSDGVDTREAVELCQLAYYNISIFRNSIDMLSDFSNSKLYLEGGNKQSKEFVESWLKKIKVSRLKDQFFRELYRSSNIFLYKINGKFKTEDYAKIRRLGLTPSTNEIPVKYILLNPAEMKADTTTSFDGQVYKKVLSDFEIEQLKNPKDDHTKEIFNAFPLETQKQIKQGGSHKSINLPIDPNKLIYCFYKKQDYEPFAAPFCFGVLDDINFKLEMKKIDQAICRTVENVVLLITMGTEPSKGGVNPKNITAMQQIFLNQSIGRVLVSDYTTKAEFLIPDLKKVLGPEKYEVVDRDIKEGLQNLILSQEKFSNTEIKVQMFLQRLNEARDIFIDEFLQPEIDQLGKDYGFKSVPQAKFETIDLEDKTQIQRVITRMMELGILHPEDGISVIETGVFPSPEKLRKSQEKLVKERKDGFYNPIVGGVPFISPEEDESQTDEFSVPSRDTKNTTPKTSGRPQGAKTLSKSNFSVQGIKEIVDKTNDLYNVSLSTAKEVFGKKRLNKSQKDSLSNMCESVIVSTPMEEWSEKVKACLKDTNLILSLRTEEEVTKISLEHDLPEYPAALLYHSSKCSS